MAQGWFERSNLFLEVDPRVRTMYVWHAAGHMFKVDGFNRTQRLKLWARGLRWLYGPGGLMADTIRPYLAWYKPGFHPWDSGMMPNHALWADALERTGDVIAASDALTAASPSVQGN